MIFVDLMADLLNCHLKSSPRHFSLLVADNSLVESCRMECRVYQAGFHFGEYYRLPKTVDDSARPSPP